MSILYILHNMFFKSIAFFLLLVIIVNVIKKPVCIEGLSEDAALAEAKLNKSRVATISEDIETFEFLNPIKTLTNLEGTEIPEEDSTEEDDSTKNKEDDNEKIEINTESNLAMSDSFHKKIIQQDKDFIEYSNDVAGSIKV